MTLWYTVKVDFNHVREVSSPALIKLDQTIANLCSNWRPECRVVLQQALDHLTVESEIFCLLDLYVAVLTLFTYPTVVVQTHLVITMLSGLVKNIIISRLLLQDGVICMNVQLIPAVRIHRNNKAVVYLKYRYEQVCLC